MLHLRNTSAQLTWFRLRDACGYEPTPAARGIRQHLATVRRRSPVIALPEDPARIGVLDWAIDSPEPGPRTEEELAAHQRSLGVDVLLAVAAEERDIYRDAAFDPDGESARTIHLGLDLFAPAGSPVFAPLDGVIEAFADSRTLRWPRICGVDAGACASRPGMMPRSRAGFGLMPRHREPSSRGATP